MPNFSLPGNAGVSGNTRVPGSSLGQGGSAPWALGPSLPTRICPSHPPQAMAPFAAGSPGQSPVPGRQQWQGFTVGAHCPPAHLMSRECLGPQPPAGAASGGLTSTPVGTRRAPDHGGSSQVVAGSRPSCSPVPTWEMRRELLVPGCGLVQSWPPGRWKTSLPVSINSAFQISK